MVAPALFWQMCYLTEAQMSPAVLERRRPRLESERALAVHGRFGCRNAPFESKNMIFVDLLGDFTIFWQFVQRTKPVFFGFY